VVFGSVGAVIAARRGAAAAGRGRGSGTLVGAAASACGPNPARPASASAARIPVWTLFKGSVLPRTSAPPRARYPRLFSVDKIDEALTPAQGLDHYPRPRQKRGSVELKSWAFIGPVNRYQW